MLLEKQLDFPDTLHWEPMALCQGGCQVGWWRQVKPSTNERWHFLKTVSPRQKSILSAETGSFVLVVFSGLRVLLCFSFLPALMPLCFSRMLLIWCKCLRDTPIPCPGWGQELPRRCGRGILAELCQPVQGAVPLDGQLQASQNGSFLGQRFCSPCPRSQAPASAGCSPGLRYQTGAVCAPVLTSLSASSSSSSRGNALSPFVPETPPEGSSFFCSLKHGGRVCSSGVCYAVVPAFSCCH